MTEMEKLYQRVRVIASKTNINVVVGSGAEQPVDIELYSPKLKPTDYPVLLMRQLKRRKVKEGAGERFVFKKGGLLCGDQK